MEYYSAIKKSTFESVLTRLCGAGMASSGCVWPLEPQVAERRYLTSKVRNGGREEIPHVQDKRNPSKRVGTEREHEKADRLKLQSQTTSQSDHMDHSLV